MFGSDYNHNGTTHLLGFIHRRPEWLGVVVGYQPGEYQPNALDALDGNNFQILANAIVFAAGALPADEVVLELTPGPAPADVSLQWTGCDATFTVFRASDPVAVTDAGNELGQTTGKNWSDTPPAGNVVYYRVLSDSAP